MELLQALPSLNLQQLLAVCQRDQIPVITHISEALLRACIEKRILELVPISSPIIFDGGPLTENLALEAKINDFLISGARQWLVSKGVPVQYLTERGWLEAAAALIYEYKFPIPDIFYFGDNIYNIYAMSPLNIRQSFSTYSNLTPEEYLYLYRQPGKNINILLYQTLPNLLAFARTLPPQGMYFETKAGVMNYLLKYPDIEKQVRAEEIRNFFSKIHDNSYPNRRSLVTQYWETDHSNEYLFAIRALSDSIMLSCPPLWFEEEYIKISLGIPSFGPKFELISSLIRGNDSLDQGVLRDATFVYNRWDPIREEIVFDPSHELTPSRSEIAEIVRVESKDFQRISLDYLRNLTGWIGTKHVKSVRDIRDYLFEEIRDNSNPQFKLVASGEGLKACPPNEPFGLTFGTFTTFNCWSVEELISSFIEPKVNSAFNRNQIRELWSVLEDHRPFSIPQYEEKVGPLLDNIKTYLN